MADTPTGNFDWVKIIAGIGPDGTIKVINTLRSALTLGINFLYPYQNDSKKMKFTITGLKLAKYLVTILGSNIKKVTWDGDNVELAFQGGSRSYLKEDVNESEGDYDSLNSAISVIDKVGPLDTNAPYIVEFNKAPKPEEWANFMISCQGLGGNLTLSDLYFSPTGENSTTLDLYYNNDYSTTDSMVPNANGSTFTPTASDALPSPSAQYRSGGVKTLTFGDTTLVIAPSASSNTTTTKYSLSAAKAGYYVIYATNMGMTMSAITSATAWNHSGAEITGHKSLASTPWGTAAGEHDEYKLNGLNVIAAFHVNADITAETEVFRIDQTASTGMSIIGSGGMVAAISRSQYEALPSTL